MKEHASLKVEKREFTEKELLDRKIDEILRKQRDRKKLLSEEVQKLVDLEERDKVLQTLEQADGELDSLERRLLDLLIKRLEKL